MTMSSSAPSRPALQKISYPPALPLLDTSHKLAEPSVRPPPRRPSAKHREMKASTNLCVRKFLHALRDTLLPLHAAGPPLAGARLFLYSANQRIFLSRSKVGNMFGSLGLKRDCCSARRQGDRVCFAEGNCWRGCTRTFVVRVLVASVAKEHYGADHPLPICVGSRGSAGQR
jgi:hypothetical protein